MATPYLGDMNTGNPVEFSRFDRRRRRRLPLSLSVSLSRDRGTRFVHATTNDVSSQGFSCSVNEPFDVGERVRCTLTIPRFDGDPVDDLTLDCWVRIVRIVGVEGGWYGVGCEIEEYRVMPARNAAGFGDV